MEYGYRMKVNAQGCWENTGAKFAVWNETVSRNQSGHFLCCFSTAILPNLSLQCLCKLCYLYLLVMYFLTPPKELNFVQFHDICHSNYINALKIGQWTPVHPAYLPLALRSVQSLLCSRKFFFFGYFLMPTWEHSYWSNALLVYNRIIKFIISAFNDTLLYQEFCKELASGTNF